MADVITRFKLETTQYDSKLRDSVKGLKEVVKTAELAGKDFKGFEKNTLESAKALGTIETGANNSKDKVKELVGAFNEMANTYNAMSKTIRESDVGKAMADSLNQMSGRIKEAKKELYDAHSSFSNGGGGLFGGGKLDGMLQVFGGNLMTKGASMLAGFASEIGNCIEQGIELARQGEGIHIAFNRLNQPGLLDNLREATHGTVTDLELMKAAVKFNDFKLPLDQLGTMLAFAQKKAKDTGQSVDYMVDSIVTGLGRKSLMILDNLGLSAAEIKEKMKETGDMTKAVGEIIRDQMSKAGGYVETAADRAQQANVNLTNAMTRLGETFQPLTDTANNMWTSIKIGALDLLNTAVTPLINALTEAGRIRSQYASQGGDTRVNRQLERLGNIHTMQYRRNTYNAQLRNYDSQINSYQQYLNDYKTWEASKRNGSPNVGAYDRMQAFKKGHNLSSYMYSDVKEQLEVFKKMRAEYVMGAKTIINDNPAPSPTSDESKTTTTGKNTPTYQAGSLAAAQADVQQLTKLWNEAGADVRDQYLQPLIEAEQKVKAMQNAMALQKEQAQGKLLGGDVQTTGLGNVVSGYDNIGKGLETLPQHLSPLQELNAELARLKANLELAPDTTAYQAGLQAIADKENEIAKFKGMDELSNGAKGTSKSFSQAANAIGQVGTALNSIEDPTARIMGIVAQAIATIAMAYSEALAKDKTNKSNVWYFIATAAAMMASMTTTIASIHSATGYKNGGMVKGYASGGMADGTGGGSITGTTYSNDQIPIQANAGEVILNKAQQSTLAASIQANGGGGMRIIGVLNGEDIVLSADRWGMRTGRGELLFGKNL